VRSNPELLRPLGRRRGSRRLVLLCAAIGMLLLAPAASSVPGDPTPPVITPLYSPAFPANGWFRGSVTVSWSVVDPESIILESPGCGNKTFSIDTPGEPVTCTAKSDGGTNSQTVTIRLDKTPPSVTATAERPPDANDWYNRPLSVSFAGTDAISGLAGCSPATSFSGPDNPKAAVAGSCTDKAGNVAGASLTFQYDATAPSVFAVTTRRGNRSAQVAWRKSSDTWYVEVLRAPGRNGAGESVVYRGSETGYRDTGLVVGRKYQYRVAGLDAAGNRAETKLELVATGALLSPAPGDRVTSPPNLIWATAKRATYYNVQLMYRGKKVLSAWPADPNYRLRRTWSYNGRRYRLRPGVYRWYVWPGLGRRSATHYGRLLGSSTFVVAK
jgi:hypothetical protein